MKREEHCAECLEKMGKEWDWVHEWLDSLAGLTWPEMTHRVERHHEEGVEEIRRKGGDEAAKAAILHIQADFNMDGLFPKYEGEVPTKKWVEKQFGIKSEEGNPWD